MARYHFSEGAFDLPPGWVDQSVHMLIRAPGGGALPESSPTLVMNREPLVGTLAEHVAKSVSALQRTLPGFRVIDERTLDVGELPAVCVEFAWRKDRAPVTQKMVFVAYAGALLTIALSAGVGPWTAGKRDFDEILASLRFRKPETLV